MGRNSTTASKNFRAFRKLLSNAEVVKRDPWHLPPVFFRTKDWSSLPHRDTTVSGYWRCSDEVIGICTKASSSSTIDLLYHGLRKTLEFYLNDGTKTDWVMHEYNICHNRPCPSKPHQQPSLFLEDEVVICKVFKKDATYSPSSGKITIAESSNADDVRATYLCKQVRDELRSPLVSAEEDPIVHCDTHAKADGDVWQHFTKIRTKNPAVEYAVCHHCDRALKAHSISQLERHRKSDKCRSSCSNPSTDQDREMLRRLRAVLDELYERRRVEGRLQCQEVNTNLAQLNPWVLGDKPWYVTTSLNRQTNEGWWEEMGEECTAIQPEQQQMQGCWTDIDKVFTAIENDQMQMQVPQYMGLRRTLEFHHIQNCNKIKTGWIMLEYQQLDVNNSPAMFLQGDMVIRKVLPYDKGAVAAIFSNFERRLNGDNDNEEHNNGEGVNTEITRKRKRSAASKRTSEVWVHFTEIRTADDDVVYAVCHYCDRGYGSARSTNGTTHLRRHTKTCTNKLQRTENANDITTEWNAEIWPRFLVLKNYLETEHQESGTC